MGRLKCFKKEDVLDKTVQLFWKLGFSKTSLSDIEQATGVNKSGLYSEFKNKDDLFAQSIHWYTQNCGLHEILLKEPFGEKNLENFLLFGPENAENKGCFVANSIREYSILPEEAKNVIAGHNQQTYQAVIKNLKAFIKDKDLEALATLVLIYKAGLALSSNMGEVKKIKKQVSYFLNGLKA